MRIGPPNNRQDQEAALGLLLGESDGAACSERLREAMAFADGGGIDLGGLVAAWEPGQVVGAALSWVGADGSAFVWPPEVAADRADREEIAVALLDIVTARADAAGCPFEQTLLETDREDQRRFFERAGFRHLTDLIFLQRPLDADLPPTKAVGGRLFPFDDRIEQRFADVIERTYVGSRDCPGFAGVRSPADALHSYRQSGMFTPERWQLVEQGGVDMAVILVNDRPDEVAREIVYLGVAPEARRGGLARRLVAGVLAEAKAAGCESVLSAVDVANEPAVKLYDRLGFFPVARRAIYLRRAFPSDASPDKVAP
jgi:ribosomal protein S18 acetylase RimI-like enzyme